MRRGRERTAVVAVVAVVATVAVLGTACAEGGREAPTPAPAPAPSASVTGRTAVGDGTWFVGSGRDVVPGEYTVRAPDASGGEGSCYYARLRDTSGEQSDIIEDHIGSGKITVRIEATDLAFVSDGCGTWERTGR